VERPGRIDAGRAGEDAALSLYLRAGYRLVARNWRSPLGELDLVLMRGQTLVFCEVKARRGTGFGGPFEAVNERKRRKLRSLAQAFLRGMLHEPAQVRFDVASVLLDRAGRASVNVFEDAF